MNVLHTADWHIGKRLYNENRYDEFEEFLQWMCHTINEYRIDVLIVAGDIFDTMTPSNKAQELYFDFLCQVNKTSIKHIIITAGNHDSPSFLDAPKSLLKAMNVCIIGALPDTIEDEVVVLYDNDIPYAIIACVPYLRDKDIRTSYFGETLTEREQNTANGIYNHYEKIAHHAKKIQDDIKSSYNKTLPIIATGHLFAIGAKNSSTDDGMRDIGGIYVGTLREIDSHIFSQFDYVALGHIHQMQSLIPNRVYYSGSPIAMGFGEFSKTKYVLLVSFDDTIPTIKLIIVPSFRLLKHITGDIDDIKNQLSLIKEHTPDDTSVFIKSKPVWLDIEYTGKKVITDLKSQIESHLANYPHLVALSIKDKSKTQIQYQKIQKGLTVRELDPYRVFADFIKKEVAAQKITDEEQKELLAAYHILLRQIIEEDKQAM